MVSAPLTPITLDIKQLSHGKGLQLPFYATSGSVGMDLCAAIEGCVDLSPFQRLLIPTGLAIALPEGCEAQIRPRSGLALKQGVTVLNAPGTIDSDYRQEIKVLLINLGQDSVVIERGDRIAQLVLAPVLKAVLKPVFHLESAADRGGFGSTGMKSVAS